jgi:hypothetical protein
MKTEVYSWRVSPDVKAKLAAEAQRRKISLSALLDDITGQWLRKHRKRIEDDEAEQARLHAAVEKVIGTVAIGLGPYTNDRVRESFQQMWAEKRARNRPR